MVKPLLKNSFFQHPTSCVAAHKIFQSIHFGERPSKKQAVSLHNRLRRWNVLLESSWMNLARYLIMPRNLCSYCLLLVVGNSWIALTFLGSGLIPLSLSTSPMNTISVIPTMHFLWFRVKPCCWQMSRTSRTLWSCFSLVRPLMHTSSMEVSTPFKSATCWTQFGVDFWCTGNPKG